MPWASRSLGLSTPASLAISRTLFATVGFIVRPFFLKRRYLFTTTDVLYQILSFQTTFFSIFCGTSIAAVEAGKSGEGGLGGHRGDCELQKGDVHAIMRFAFG
jgi:hypothetical protein